MTAPAALKPDAFFALAKEEQAALVWQALFVERLPVSEAARGVITVLHALGLDDALQARDLESIRAWFASQDADEHVERVFKLAGVRYAVMTNIPFAEEEALHWRPQKTPYSARFRSALRVGELLASACDITSGNVTTATLLLMLPPATSPRLLPPPPLACLFGD